MKLAVVVGVAVAGGWIMRDDHLCREEIKHRFGDVITVEHPFASNVYRFVPPSWKGIWQPGMQYPVTVTCWADIDGVSGFTRL